MKAEVVHLVIIKRHTFISNMSIINRSLPTVDASHVCTDNTPHIMERTDNDITVKTIFAGFKAILARKPPVVFFSTVNPIIKQLLLIT